MKIGAIEKYGVKSYAVVTRIVLLKFSKGSPDDLTLEYNDGTGKRCAAKATTVPG